MFEPVPQFSTTPHEQDESVHAVFLQVSYFSFSPPQGSTSCVLAARALVGVGFFQS